jgi:hypothetical protein
MLRNSPGGGTMVHPFRSWRGFALGLSGALLIGALPADAQTSASYQLTESAINCGGDPQNGTVLTSASFKVTLDAIGDAIAGGPLASSSYSSDVGLPPSLKPPGEVSSLRFTDKTTLAWHPEGSVGTYRLYRGLLTDLPTSYGTCQTPGGLTTEQATDATTPSPGQCFVYLVTARNRISEEGTMGSTSSGTPIPNTSPCP